MIHFFNKLLPKLRKTLHEESGVELDVLKKLSIVGIGVGIAGVGFGVGFGGGLGYGEVVAIFVTGLVVGVVVIPLLTLMISEFIVLLNPMFLFIIKKPHSILSKSFGRFIKQLTIINHVKFNKFKTYLPVKKREEILGDLNELKYDMIQNGLSPKKIKLNMFKHKILILFNLFKKKILDWLTSQSEIIK